MNEVIPSDETLRDASDIGDFTSLFVQLDGVAPAADLDGCYAALFSRMNSADYRRLCGLAIN